MIPITKPTFPVKEVFTSCISKTRSLELRDALNLCVQIIEEKSQDFETKLLSSDVYLFPQEPIILAPIGKNEMINVYKNGMLNKKMPGRVYYDQIRSLAKDDICPLCSIRYVSSVDHYLPKTLYPVLAVTPINLIPSCNSCNGDKSNRYPTSTIDQSLHPYFDNVNDENWIKATLLKTNPVSLTFFPHPPEHWDSQLRERAINHFNTYNLNEVFSSNANRLLRGNLKVLRSQFQIHPEKLKGFLFEIYQSNLALGINSFEAILYFTLFSDDWFCNYGVNIE